eukprot:10460917-Heterocapsa_arctica.AAC.1
MVLLLWSSMLVSSTTMTSLSSSLSALSQHQQVERPWTPPSSGNASSKPWESSSARPNSFGGGIRSSPGDFSKFGELDRAMVAMAGRTGQA